MKDETCNKLCRTRDDEIWTCQCVFNSSYMSNLSSSQLLEFQIVLFKCSRTLSKPLNCKLYFRFDCIWSYISIRFFQLHIIQHITFTDFALWTYAFKNWNWYYFFLQVLVIATLELIEDLIWLNLHNRLVQSSKFWFVKIVFFIFFLSYVIVFMCLYSLFNCHIYC